MTAMRVSAKLLVTVSLVVILVLGLAIGHVVANATDVDAPMQTMSGMDGDDMTQRMHEMSAHMGEMDMESMLPSGSRGGSAKPGIHDHD